MLSIGFAEATYSEFHAAVDNALDRGLSRLNMLTKCLLYLCHVRNVTGHRRNFHVEPCSVQFISQALHFPGCLCVPGHNGKVFCAMLC